jgi:hypothetical protein
VDQYKAINKGATYKSSKENDNQSIKKVTYIKENIFKPSSGEFTTEKLIHITQNGAPISPSVLAELYFKYRNNFLSSRRAQDALCRDETGVTSP